MICLFVTRRPVSVTPRFFSIGRKQKRTGVLYSPLSPSTAFYHRSDLSGVQLDALSWNDYLHRIMAENLTLFHSIKKPEYVLNPSYSLFGTHQREIMALPVPQELVMAAQWTRKLLQTARRDQWIKPGVTALDVDNYVRDWCLQQHIYPAPLAYGNFPAHCTVSINNVVCHGIPDRKRFFQVGDIVNLDVSLFVNGWFGDASDMFVVDRTSPEKWRLITATRTALDAAIAECKPGAPLNAIAKAIHSEAAQHGFSIVSKFCGHGIGKRFHQFPLIQHQLNSDETAMTPGMVFTIEPILVEGSPALQQWTDQWTFATKQHGWSAQWEEMVAITETGHWVLSADLDDMQNQRARKEA